MLFKNVSSDFSFKGHDGVALFNFGSYTTFIDTILKGRITEVLAPDIYIYIELTDLD